MARNEGEKRLVGSRDAFYEHGHLGVLLIYGTRLKPYRSKCIHVVFRLLCYSGQLLCWGRLSRSCIASVYCRDAVLVSLVSAG